MDASLIANEVIDSMLKKGGKVLCANWISKKAYDQINWNFLLTVLHKMGFGGKWVNWLKRCISIALFSISVSGCPISFFKSSGGLRQGDPLSLYLFVLGMETLSVLIGKAGSEGFLVGYRIANRSGEEERITHLLFADDTLIFCKDSAEEMVNLSWLLLWYEAFSGLKINLEKSFVMEVGDVANLDDLALELGCTTTTLPNTYLGLGMRCNSLSVWDGMEERFRKKLAIWKR